MGLNVREDSGFTLIEILITMAVVSIIMVAVIAAFNIQQKSQVKQQLIAEVQQNARAAMYMIARDIRMTGFGLGDGEVTYWEAIGESSYMAINIINGGANPDRIEVLYATPVDLQNGCEVNALTTSLVNIAEDPLNVSGETCFVSGENVILTNGDHSSLLWLTDVQPQILGHDPDTGVNPPAGSVITAKGSYDVGSTVYKLRYVTYAINGAGTDNPTLRLDDTGPIDGDQLGSTDVIAEDIEDLQAVYVFEDGDTASAYNDTDADTTNDYADIRAVKVNIVARTRVKNENFDGDGYGRRNLELELKIRNFGL